MGMMDWMTGGAGGDLSSGNNQANGYMQPFYNGGQNAFNQWQQNTTNMGNDLSQYHNMGQQQWQASQQTPQQYYQNIMSGYQQSPQAAYAQQQAQRAGNAAGAASGMIGSGAFVNGMQRNANQISQGDQQQYYNNVMGSNQAQMQDLQNYQGQQSQYNNMLGQQANIGYGAAGQMGNWAMQNGMQQAYQDNQGMDNMFGLAGASQAAGGIGGLISGIF